MHIKDLTHWVILFNRAAKVRVWASRQRYQNNNKNTMV